MPTENLLTYTKIDPGEFLTVTADRIQATNSPWLYPGGTKVYKDFGEGYFDALNINFEVFLDSLTGNSCVNYLLCLSNSVAEVTDFDDHDIMVSFDKWSENDARISLFRGGDFREWLEWPAQQNTLYYLTLSRSARSSRVNLHVYADKKRTNRLATLTVTGLAPQTKWRYLYGYNVFSQRTDVPLFTGYVQFIDLGIKPARKTTG